MNVIEKLEAEHAARFAGAKTPSSSPATRSSSTSRSPRRAHPRSGLRGHLHRRSGAARRELHCPQISYGAGVDRVFPIYSPMIDSVKVLRRGKLPRETLLSQDRRGKSAPSPSARQDPKGTRAGTRRRNRPLA